MEIRRRVRKLISATKFVHPPKKVSKELASLEALAGYQRWLRGVLCLLAFSSFAFSLVAIEDFTLAFLCDLAVLIISIFGEVCLLKVYQIKAKHAGVTDPIYRTSNSVLHSPHFFKMLAEMFVWTLFCPPGLSWYWPDAPILDFLVVFRFYCVLLYLNNATFGYRTFCRAMSAIANIPLSTSYYLRTMFMFDTLRTSLSVLTGGWCALALMFGKAEDLGFWDSMYFCFVTAATIGYGDITPKTTPGRLVAFFSWIFGLTVVAWVVGLTHEALSLTNPERNLFTLFQANELCNKLPIEAAKVIQRAYRLSKAQEKRASIVRLNWLGYKLTSQVNTLRRERHRLRTTEASFMTELANFENDNVDEGISPAHSDGVDTSRLLPTTRSANDMCETPMIGQTHAAVLESSDNLLKHSERVPLHQVPSARLQRAVDYADDNDDTASVEEMKIVNPKISLSQSTSPESVSPLPLVQRLGKLEVDLDNLISLAETLVRKRASQEEPRRQLSEHLTTSS